MSLVNNDQLSNNFWHHICDSKHTALVYTPNGTNCFYCGKNITLASGTAGLANTGTK
jgi:hypothetical protein